MRRDATQAHAAREAPPLVLAGEWRAAVAVAWRALWRSRLLVWVSGIAAVAAWGYSPGAAAFDPASLTRPYGGAGNALVAVLARWDSVWYLAIAHDGYPGADDARAAFFPLYPLLVRAGGVLLGSPLLAGALISTGCFGVALVLLHRLTELELGSDAAGAAVRALAFFPMAFFFSAVYSESLFLVLSIGSFYAARTRRWVWAGAIGALAAATRSAGIVLVIPLVLLWLADARGRRFRDALWIGLVPVGLAAFSGWLALRGGDGGAPFHAQAVWQRHFAGPFAGLRDGAVAAWDGARQLLSANRDPVYFTKAAGDPFSIARENLMLFGFAVAAVPAIVGVWRRLPPAYGAYTVCALALPLSWPVGPQPLMSLPRFQAVLFPLFMWLGAWTAGGGRRREQVLLGLSGLGLAIFTGLFATWHWVA